jgi:hypothetical protein
MTSYTQAQHAYLDTHMTLTTGDLQGLEVCANG